ncbi:class I glutamine amidotransferase-like protein [Phyllosticta citribraziliensis]|uniref:Class I glutamine amidotransferase-like protein n=1 Tax=Phyllosticta citribraziliensis TaxID=989973 RepID=A0ABR1LPI4_9PEZI
MVSQRNFNVAAFNTDPTVPAVHNKRGLYSDIFQHELSAAAQRLAASSSHKTPVPALKWSSYNVVQGEYPSHPAELDAIVISGSASSVYEPQPWIDRLRVFIQHVYANHPHVRFYGSCFGHQILCQSLLEPFGGLVEKSPAGWEVGVQPVRITTEFLAAFPVDVHHLPSARKADELVMRLQFVHADHVVLPGQKQQLRQKKRRTGGYGGGGGVGAEMLPPDWVLIGSSALCHVQGMHQPGRVFTLQGHFEFDRFINSETVKVFGENWSPDFMADAQDMIQRDDDAKWVAEIVMTFLLGEGRQEGFGAVMGEGGLLTPPDEVDHMVDLQ